LKWILQEMLIVLIIFSTFRNYFSHIQLFPYLRF
jgi:hypothetical protein